MEHEHLPRMVFLEDEELLQYLSGDCNVSPEEFLATLEEKLETGEITMDDAAMLIHDHFNCNERKHQ